MGATLRRLIRPEQIRELSLVFLILLIVIFFGLQIQGYFSARMVDRVSASVAIVAVVAVGETLVVLTRNIDLSVGSIVGFTAYFVGTQLAHNNNLNPIAVVLLAIGLGALMGLINGVLISYGGVPAIITTLGTLAIYRTILIQYSGAKTVTTDSLPAWVVDLPRVSWLTLGPFELRPMVVVALAIVILFQLVLVYTSYGRRLYAIGSNPDAARFAGLPTRQIVLIAYGLCGALAGMAGFMFLARFGTVTTAAAQGMELDVVAAVVVGGVNIFGGSGTMFGALLGAVMIDTLQESLIRWLQISQFWQQALLGFLILIAVATDAVILERVRRLWAKSGLKLIDSAAATKAPEHDA